MKALHYGVKHIQIGVNSQIIHSMNQNELKKLPGRRENLRLGCATQAKESEYIVYSLLNHM